MLHELQPTIERARQLGKQQIDVWVDWGNDATVVVSPFGECRLSVRLSGHEISYAVGVCWRRLHVRFAVGTAPAGTSFLAELRWQGGSRNLHVLAPPCTVNLHNLVLPPPSNQPNDDDAGESARVLDARGLLDRIDAAEAAAPPLPLHAETFSRGFGLELEYLTEAERDEKGTSLKREQLQDALARLSEPTGTSPEADRHLDGIRASLARCREWNSSIDIAILPTPQSLSNRMLDATGVLGAMVDAVRRAEVRQRSLNMLLRRGAITKSEFQSPLPPDELRFERAAALDIGCFIHGALGATGAVATTISAACHCSTTLHVHVNVRNPEAGGALLTAEEILDVFFHWVRFDQVTQPFARPWMWREPSCAPLLATGAEMGSLEDPWGESQGARSARLANILSEGGAVSRTVSRAEVVDASAEVAPPSACLAADEGDAAPAAAIVGEPSADQQTRSRYDVPAFVRATWALLHADGFEELTEQQKIGRLFGLGSPAEALTRECSINLMAIRKHGTLEFRRFHGSLDATLIARWCHFCVGFVERFRSRPWRVLREPSAEAALQTLLTAQEHATADELMKSMQGLVDPATATYFATDACGPLPNRQQE